MEAELAKCLEEQQQLEREIITRSKLLRRSLGRSQQQLCHSDTEAEQSADGDESHISQLQHLQQELAEANERRNEAEAYCSQLQDDLQAIRAHAELQQFHAVEREREKWEEREQRWLAQLARLETRMQLIETTGLRSRSQSTSRSMDRPPSSATSYRIVSNLTDISNYPDTISNYFFTSIYTGQSMKFEFLLF